MSLAAAESPLATGPGQRERVAIVGGGLLGLTLALRLAQRGAQVSVLDAARELGGLAAPWRIGDVVWDRHYHVTLYSDTALRSLLRELELEHEVVWKHVQTGFYTDGRFHPMNGVLDFLRFPALGFFDKLRLGATILGASRIADPLPLESISVEEWLVSRSGRRAFERIWRPLLRAKLGERYHEASAAFLWAIIVRLHAARRAGLGRERFGYVPGGYARIIAALEANLRARGVQFLLGQPVERITRQSGAITIQSGGSALRSFDRAVVTVAANRAAAMCASLEPDERASLETKRYQGIVCASLLLDESLGPYYVTNLTDEWVPFSAVIEMTALVDCRTFGGRALVYLPKYVAPNDPLFEAADHALEDEFCAALARMYPHFSRDRVRAFRVSRAREVFPIATLDYSRSLPPIASSVPGLFFVNSAHIVNGTLNVNETVALAERAVEQVAAGLQAATT